MSNAKNITFIDMSPSGASTTGVPVFVCDACPHHKGMINPKRGVKIPGGSGKCIRDGGLCDAMTTYTINIDMDKKCVRCGKGGSTQGGYCLKCINMNLIEGKYDHILKPIQKKVLGDYMKITGGKAMSKIGEKTIGFLQDTISGFIRDKKADINDAYIRGDGDKLTIAISATLSPGKGDQIKCKVGINFVTDRVKEELEADIDEAQGELFGKQE